MRQACPRLRALLVNLSGSLSKLFKNRFVRRYC